MALDMKRLWLFRVYRGTLYYPVKWEYTNLRIPKKINQDFNAK